MVVMSQVSPSTWAFWCCWRCCVWHVWRGSFAPCAIRSFDAWYPIRLLKSSGRYRGFQSQDCGRKKPWLKSLITSTAPPNMGIWWTISGLMGNMFLSVAGIPNWAAVTGSRGRWLMIRSITGWWFQTFFIFPYIGNNNPNWLYKIFQRGRYTYTTNQWFYAQ